MNVAARLEQAAASGEVLIGAGTRLLVRDAVRVEAFEPLALKGKSEPVEAYWLLEVLAGAESLARHPETPLVGRERERQRLWRDYEDAVADRTCRLFTLLGPAGIGKSRLVADFLERVGDTADVLRGRCLHYGEGITYWPLVEILIAIGVDPDSVIGTSPPETQLGFRRLVETRAVERPQVVVIDDLQWAEPVFIDLVEHVADLSRDAPIFLLCVARTELLDVRPGWGGGKLNATSLLLEPLDAGECAELMERLVAGARLDAELRERITVASAGNPLFVEEMLAMVREHGDGGVVVPPTIQALLQARIDSLDGDVRVVMERGAVEGEVFHRRAVAELSPDSVRSAVEAHLATLVRKELIRSTAPTFPEDEGFRFRHLLIRDAAYESLPKTTRAELHERFSDWLAGHEFVERDEILGYHLEQAHRYRAELDLADPALAELSGRAAHHLAAGGRGALSRGDYNAGRALLRRAAAILPPGDERRLGLAPELFEALWESGEQDEARAVIQAALRAPDPVVRAIASILDYTATLVRGGPGFEDRKLRRDEARAVLEDAGHDAGLSLYWGSIATEAWFRCRAVECAAAVERSLAYAELAGIERRLQGTWRICACYVYAPTPVAEALERVGEIRTRAHDAILLEAWSSACLGRLLAMRDESQFERARELVRGGRETFREAGVLVTAGGMSMPESSVEARAGDLEAVERVLRAGLEDLEQIGERGYAPTAALVLADCLYAQGRLDEVEPLCTWARERTGGLDIANFIFLDALEGGLLAHRGKHEDAAERARAALALAETTDFFEARAWARVMLAGTHAIAGRMAEASELAVEAIRIHQAKGDVTGAARARERLERLGIVVGR